jgi:subtilisin family serine protease
MRHVAKAAILTIATVVGAFEPALGQTVAPPNNPPPVVTHGGTITPLGWYAIGSIGCAAVSPMIATVVLGRELTFNEAYRLTFGCLLGPPGWLLADALVPPTVTGPIQPLTSPQPPRPPRRTARGRNIHIPPAGETHFLSNEILVRFDASASADYIAGLTRSLQLTPLETVTFALTGDTVQRLRIDGPSSVRRTLLALRSARVAEAQANMAYLVQQGAPASAHESAADATSAQYVVSKLHLLEAHRISNGDDVLVAVIDSQIDTKHPDLAGVIADQYDVIGTPAEAHLHGTAMAGAIAAHSRLVGVAPKVRLLAVRAFAGQGESAQSTTFNILKGIDWAASKSARVVNMSFAGPTDGMVREMLDKANARGIVLIAAVGNAGPRSPPLYPAAYPHVIGITATDADDKLMPQANRGPQVVAAAPGVEILAPAPGGSYQVTSGTSVAAAHASGVAALLLARRPNLSSDDVRRVLTRTAHVVPGNRNDTGAGVIDALGAVNSLRN